MRLGDLHRSDRGRKVGPRAHPIPDLVEVVPQDRPRTASRSCPSTPGAPLLALTCRHASHTIDLGIANGFSSGFGMFARFLPEAHRPRLIESDIPDQPAPSLHPHPRSAGASRLLRAGPPASAATGTQCLRFPPSARSLSPPVRLTAAPDGRFRRSPSHVPCQSRRPGSRRLHAGHHLASHRDTRQAHHGRTARPPAFDATSIVLTTPQQRTPTPRTPGGRLLERLPGPHLTRQARLLPDRSPRRSSANAASGGLTPPPKDDAGGPTSLHLQHSTASMKIAYINPPSAFVTHGCRTRIPRRRFVVISSQAAGAPWEGCGGGWSANRTYISFS